MSIRLQNPILAPAFVLVVFLGIAVLHSCEPSPEVDHGGIPETMMPQQSRVYTAISKLKRIAADTPDDPEAYYAQLQKCDAEIRRFADLGATRGVPPATLNLRLHEFFEDLVKAQNVRR